MVKVNPDGKRFERVDRLQCRAKTYETDLYIDVASEIFPVKVGDKLNFALAWTLNRSGEPDSDHYAPDGKVRKYIVVEAFFLGGGAATYGW